MAMIDIEYKYSDKSLKGVDIRRLSTDEMSQYLRDLVSEMQASDFYSKLTITKTDGPNMVYINKKSVPEILNALEIKLLESEESCDHNKINIMKMDRPTLSWNKEYIEDIPDTLMKNAIAKIFADINDNRIL